MRIVAVPLFGIRALQTGLAYVTYPTHIVAMRKGDVQCPACRAGYRRIELVSMKSPPGEYRCLICSHPLETLTGQTYVAYRLTVQPEKVLGT